MHAEKQVLLSICDYYLRLRHLLAYFSQCTSTRQHKGLAQTMGTGLESQSMQNVPKVSLRNTWGAWQQALRQGYGASFGRTAGLKQGFSLISARTRAKEGRTAQGLQISYKLFQDGSTGRERALQLPTFKMHSKVVPEKRLHFGGAIDQCEDIHKRMYVSFMASALVLQPRGMSCHYNSLLRGGRIIFLAALPFSTFNCHSLVREPRCSPRALCLLALGML